MEGGKILWSGTEREHVYGVGMVIGEKARKALLEYNPVNERMMYARFKGYPRDIDVVVAYAPTMDHSDAEIEAFYDQLEQTLNVLPKKDVKIITGDWNAKIGRNNIGFEEVMGKYGIGNRNNRGERLLEFAKDQKIVLNAEKEYSHAITKANSSPSDSQLVSLGRAVPYCGGNRPEKAVNVLKSSFTDVSSEELWKACIIARAAMSEQERELKPRQQKRESTNPSDCGVQQQKKPMLLLLSNKELELGQAFIPIDQPYSTISTPERAIENGGLPNQDGWYCSTVKERKKKSLSSENGRSTSLTALMIYKSKRRYDLRWRRGCCDVFLAHMLVECCMVWSYVHVGMILYKCK
ncbi:hypothetical protein HELRODRAFT_182479 [Helobdella robusta]|uniref:Endonuclease/exonuclease/phosphatase domain-containing protein n=1 Tax=Helobdella robusta TaxID=6412 RepID=T1FI92_HELRO|nr:hypothetical protein HELRODRAFT_182479 [Helobdella robusta]ESN90896.1 hypothetical protein HELRODRAFT_182479 [Helobdella robusta]